jgi:hypothetical protein
VRPAAGSDPARNPAIVEHDLAFSDNVAGIYDYPGNGYDAAVGHDDRPVTRGSGAAAGLVLAHIGPEATGPKSLGKIGR